MASSGNNEYFSSTLFMFITNTEEAITEHEFLTSQVLQICSVCLDICNFTFEVWDDPLRSPDFNLLLHVSVRSNINCLSLSFAQV